MDFSDMLYGGNVALFRTMGGILNPHGGNMKNWRCCSYGNFRDKNHCFHLPAKELGVR